MEVEMEFESASAADLPNELWVEIFKDVDTCDLLNLSLVCKHFNRLVFTHMARRFRYRLSMVRYLREEYKCRLVPERAYKHICLESPRLDISPEMIKVAERLIPDVESLKLELWQLECNMLMPLLKLCSRMHTLHIKSAFLEYNERTNDPILVLPAVSCLVYDVGFSENLEKFLPTFPNVRHLRIVISGSMGPVEILKVFAAMPNCLPNVEKLQVSGNRTFTAVELVSMKCLKELIIDDMEMIRRGSVLVILPQVETFKCKMTLWDDINDVLIRFPNIKYLSVSINILFDARALRSFAIAGHCLKELAIKMRRLTPETVGLIQQLYRLEKLSIEAPMIAKSNFSKLRKVIAMPELRRLEIQTECFVPVFVSTAVAATNRSCQLLLNGRLVCPAATATGGRRAGMKRKHTKHQ